MRIINLTREQLYKEMWLLSGVGVAEKYNLNYSKLFASCKEANIPLPPPGYWTKKSLGEDLSKLNIPLSGDFLEIVPLVLKNDSKKDTKLIPPKKEEEKVVEESVLDFAVFKPVFELRLPFLDQSERERALRVAFELTTNKKRHQVVRTYKVNVNEWTKKSKENRGYPPKRYREKEFPPFVEDVSKEGLERAYPLLDMLFYGIEKLGGKVNADLSIIIGKDKILYNLVESKDKITHQITKSEAKELLEYEIARKTKSWASKPQIRKYDYIYNGKIRFSLGGTNYVKDTPKIKIEDNIEEIFIRVLEKSYELKIEREKREEQTRQYEEEKRRQEDYEELVRKEKNNTQRLINEAEDYKTASDIRRYIIGAQKSNNGRYTQEWFEWAKKKADWFDPTLILTDVLIGQREYGKSKKEKELIEEKHSTRMYW